MILHGLLLIIAALSTVLSHFIAVAGIPNSLGDWMQELPVHRHVVVIMIAF